MIENLKQRGYFREITTEGRRTLVLNAPVLIVISSAVMYQLRAAFIPTEETGGVLFAYPSANQNERTLLVKQWVLLPNQLPADSRKKSYQASGAGFQRAITQALDAGALPIRFHSHPLETGDSVYDGQALAFFQRTSQADRHNSFLPLTVGGYHVILPDGLLSANDRAGNDIRFYVYNGFIAPLALRGLLNGERVYLYVVAAVFLLYIALGRFTRLTLLTAALGALVVFGNEERKRPRYSKDSAGNLLIQIP